MTFMRKAALFALLLPAALVAQGKASQPTQAQLKARAELARQRALQQQAAQTKSPPAATPGTKTATPQTRTAAGAPQTRTQPPAVPQTKTVTAPPQTKTTPAAPQTKTAVAPPPAPQTKAAAPQTKTATAPAGQTKAPPAGSALGAGQQQATTRPQLQPKPPEEVTFNREVFTYVKGNRRDPFVSMITSSDLRPQIGDLRLVTVIHSTSGGSSVAIMRDRTTKEQYRVRVGQTLGRMRVAQIQPRAVVFSIEEFGYNRQEVVSMDDSTRARTP